MASLSSKLDCGENAEMAVVHTVLDIDPDEPANMTFFVAFEWTQALPQSCRLNTIAPRNMLSMLLTLDTSHFEMSRSNDRASRNMPGMLVTLDTSHCERSLLNDFAQWNISDMSLTFDTSHFEMPLRNNFASENMRLMSVTLDTSQSLIAPCGPLEQSPFGDNLRHASTALLSFALDRGKRAGAACVDACVRVCVRACTHRFKIELRVRVKVALGICICSRTTTARIRQYADE